MNCMYCTLGGGEEWMEGVMGGRRSDSYAVGDCRDPGMPTQVCEVGKYKSQVFEVGKYKGKMQRQMIIQKKYKYSYAVGDCEIRGCQPTPRPRSEG